MPPKHDAGTATRHYRAFWQRRCRAAAAEAVLKPCLLYTSQQVVAAAHRNGLYFVPVDLGVLVKDVATNMTVNARKAYALYRDMGYDFVAEEKA